MMANSKVLLLPCATLCLAFFVPVAIPTGSPLSLGSDCRSESSVNQGFYDLSNLYLLAGVATHGLEASATSKEVEPTWQTSKLLHETQSSHSYSPSAPTAIFLNEKPLGSPAKRGQDYEELPSAKRFQPSSNPPVSSHGRIDSQFRDSTMRASDSEINPISNQPSGTIRRDAGGVKLGNPSGSIPRADPVESDLMEVSDDQSPRITFYKFQVPIPGGAQPMGQIMEPLLAEFHKSFSMRVERAASHTPENENRMHPSLPFVLTARQRDPASSQLRKLAPKGKKSFRPNLFNGGSSEPADDVVLVSRVLEGPSSFLQKTKKINFLYKNLIAWVYEHQERLLNSFNIPVALYKVEQRKLLTWLEKQIFAPDHSLPLFQIIRPPYPVWKPDLSDQSLGPTQIKLIRFFSLEKETPEVTEAVASDLLQTYQIENRIDYSLLSQPSNIVREHWIKTAQKAHFKLVTSFLLTLAPSPADVEHHSWSLGQHHPAVQLLRRYSTEFRARSFQLYPRHRHDEYVKVVPDRSYHPKLPIAVYFSNRKVGYQPLRSLWYMSRNVVKPDVINQSFTSLIKFLDNIHLKALLHYNIPATESAKNREKLLQWLMQSIFEPTDSLPVIGFTKVHGTTAPWDEPTKKSEELFGRTQRILIIYFSQYPTYEYMKAASVSLLATWYKDCHPSAFYSNNPFDTGPTLSGNVIAGSRKETQARHPHIGT
ncbi:hypothetical protein PGT21_001414 [Puccinia graminis f. sp. tritici]|uniref:Uncharacterized protein n=1 Tax=Puccinia graminis f. sp. tritici TaxID=56615 RepID=A0A5B0ME28_PUCGR|nr:hypothetical protein PGT21_001414 [Puccinia graminis f. sp. tritici]